MKGWLRRRVEELLARQLHP